MHGIHEIFIFSIIIIILLNICIHVLRKTTISEYMTNIYDSQAIQLAASIFNTNNMEVTNGNFNTLTVYGNVNTLPRGLIIAWAGDLMPAGWTLCDGTNGTPDLRNVFIIGAGNKYSIGDKGGSANINININNMPSHSHSYAYGNIDNNEDVLAGSDLGLVPVPPLEPIWQGQASTQTGIVGDNTPLNIMPPYYIFAYIMKL